MCVSGAFAKLAPILCFAAPFVRRATGPEALALALGVGVVAAAQTFVYAVGFYVSSGARHLARGAPGYVLYLLLFAATLALVPLFSLFELSAIVASPLFAARRGAEARGKRAPPRGFSGGGADARSAGSASSSDSMIGSDGEVRRWRGGGKSRRRGGGGAGWVRASRERKRSRTESNRKVRKVFGRALRVLRAAGGDDGGDDGNGDRGGSAAAFLPKRSRRRAEARVESARKAPSVRPTRAAARTAG